MISFDFPWIGSGFSQLGPQEAEREKHRKWIRDSLERLNTEIDSHEAEIEKYKSQSKKGRIKGTSSMKILDF